MKNWFRKDKFERQDWSKNPIDILSLKTLIPFFAAVAATSIFMTDDRYDRSDREPKEDMDIMEVVPWNDLQTCPAPDSEPLNTIISTRYMDFFAPISVLPEIVMFNPNEYTLNHYEEQMIKTLVTPFQDNDNVMVVVYGCSDNTPARGLSKEESDAYNERLRILRAESVAGAVREHIPDERICTVTKCKDRGTIGVVKLVPKDGFLPEDVPDLEQDGYDQPGM